VPSDAAAIRRFAGRALVGGLCLAAGMAVIALLTGDFGDTETRVILTSIGFAATSGTGSAGATARLRPSERLQLLGGATVVASIATFGLLVLGLWTSLDDWGSEGLWRAFGCFGVLAVAGSHACVMLAARRPRDSDAIRLLTIASLAFSAIDTTAAILPIAGLVDDVNEGWARLVGATLVLLVLTSVLPPILRRMRPAAAPAPATANGKPDAAPDFFATAVVQIVDRIDVLNADPGNRSPEIGAELKRLRSLAQSFEK
jgi:hypothetical protein